MMVLGPSLARRKESADLLRLLVSVNSDDQLYYKYELPGPQTSILYTASAPAGAARPTGRINSGDIPALADSALVYICGSERFAEAAADLVLASGIPAGRMRIEKFGPSG
jgi:ferredoxin-NADP reductase